MVPSTNGSGVRAPPSAAGRDHGAAPTAAADPVTNGARASEPDEEADPPPQSSARRKGSRPSGSTKEEAVGETHDARGAG